MEEAQKPSAGDKDAALKGITALRDEMCACKDTACGEAVYKKWGDVEKASEGARHDEATKEAWNKIDDELMEVQERARGAVMARTAIRVRRATGQRGVGGVRAEDAELGREGAELVEGGGEWGARGVAQDGRCRSGR